MGDVYLAYDEPLRRQVALKVLPPELAGDRDLVRRFHAEAATVAALDHPHVVPVYYHGQDGDYHYFAMKYVAGESLEARLARCGPVAVEEALAVLEQGLLGLEAAHEQGIAHRDVKPANLLIEGKTGRVLLARFRHAERAPETEADASAFRAAGYTDITPSTYVNEGQGDYLLVGGVVLGASGFRTDARSHDEVAEFTGLPATSQIKSLVMVAGDKPILALLRGDHSLSETKFAAVSGVAIAQTTSGGAAPGNPGPSTQPPGTSRASEEPPAGQPRGSDPDWCNRRSPDGKSTQIGCPPK